jgi:hypothetical protein
LVIFRAKEGHIYRLFIGESLEGGVFYDKNGQFLGRKVENHEKPQKSVKK